jgi:hypothetical protein
VNYEQEKEFIRLENDDDDCFCSIYNVMKETILIKFKFLMFMSAVHFESMIYGGAAAAVQ